MGLNTFPDQYVHDICDYLNPTRWDPAVTFSGRIVQALREREPRLATRDFRRAVLAAVFDDSIADAFHGAETYARRVFARAQRRFGKKRARSLVLERSVILRMIRNMENRPLPDAFVVDFENSTIVCYEAEDTHPLNVDTVARYGRLYWLLEALVWDLHLIAYDVFGNHRVLDVFSASSNAPLLADDRLALRSLKRQRREGVTAGEDLRHYEQQHRNSNPNR